MEKIVNMIIEAYINVMGVDKWNALSESKQHDVIMKLASDLDKLL